MPVSKERRTLVHLRLHREDFHTVRVSGRDHRQITVSLRVAEIVRRNHHGMVELKVPVWLALAHGWLEEDDIIGVRG